MNKLQNIFEEQLAKMLRPEKVITEYICNKCQNIGIILNKKQREKLRDQLRNLDQNSLSIAIDDNQITKAGFKSNEEFQNILKKQLENITPDLYKLIENIYADLPDLLQGMINETSEVLLKALIKSSKSMFRNRKNYEKKFEKNMAEDWGNAIKILEMLLVLSTESAEEINSDERSLVNAASDFVFDVLIRLHARACQITSEIIVLLKTGHADGAHARWRTLHEIVVTSYLILKFGNDLAEKYLLHESIDSYKASIIYQNYCEALNCEPLTSKEMEELKNIHDELINKYGKSYKNDYGWASHSLNIEQPTFRDIEKYVGLDYLRPYYKMASHNVHANAKGIYFKLGLLPDENDLILAGPSNIGLEDPINLTSISLGQITTNLLTYKPNLDKLTTCYVIRKLCNNLENIL